MQTFASPLEKVQLPGCDVPIFIKRDDLLHPIASGNKWRKLKYLIQDLREQGYQELATFGGAYSNHMIATACAGASLGIKTHGFVRGHEPMDSHYLGLAHMHGMNIIQVNRADYKDKQRLFDAHFDADKVYFVDEGGKSPKAWRGVSEIIDEIELPIYSLVHASATGTTAKGLSLGIEKSGKSIDLHSIAVLQNKEEQEAYLLKSGATLHVNYTFDGYAKTTAELLHFCKEFTSKTGVLIDPIYTGKALFGLRDLLNSEIFEPKKPVVFLHTGGMLGVLSKSMMNKMVPPGT